MRAWGLNTMGDWSSGIYFRVRKTPYAINLEPKGAVPIKGFWKKFNDPYDPGYAAAIQRGFASIADTADDPFCIGYFVDNELDWGTDAKIAGAMLACPPTQAGKQRFVQLLQQKYTTIDSLNAVWNTHLQSWDALRNGSAWPR